MGWHTGGPCSINPVPKKKWQPSNVWPRDSAFWRLFFNLLLNCVLTLLSLSSCAKDIQAPSKFLRLFNAFQSQPGLGLEEKASRCSRWVAAAHKDGCSVDIVAKSPVLVAGALLGAPG